MNSSISTSEPGAWRRVLRGYAVGCLGFAVLAAVFVIAVDPYDSGRFGLPGDYGVPAFGQRLTGASLARERTTEAAVVGNSTVQLIDPARLTRLTGVRFVSLAIPATGPSEQLAVARWLVRRHDGISGPLLRALVLGLDMRWCQGRGGLAVAEPFPFWLYRDSIFGYVRHLLNLRGLQAGLRRARLMLGLEPPLRADGYRDFEPELARNQAAAAADFAQGRNDYDQPGDDDFAALGRLRDFLAGAPATIAVALVFVPRYAGSLPAAGGAADRHTARCKAAFRELAAARPHTAVLDFLKDDALARDRNNFWDRVHYRKTVAHLIEDKIAATLQAVAPERRKPANADRRQGALLAGRDLL